MPTEPLTPEEIAEARQLILLLRTWATGSHPFSDSLMKSAAILLDRLLSAAEHLAAPPRGLDSRALDALKNHRQQIDEDGVMVGVSRQALDEVLLAVERLAECERQLADMTSAMFSVAEVGDGFGPTNQQSGTTGEGHAECRRIAMDALGITFEDLPESAHGMDAYDTWLKLRERHTARAKEPTP